MTRSAATTARRLSQALAWAVVAVVVAVLAVVVVVPRMAGATPYTVLTSSMEPTLPPGTLVVSRPAPFEEILVGQVVTFQIESGDPTVATHRVIARTTEPDGTPVLWTQGDANAVRDPQVVRAEQVRGVLWYRVQELGRLNTAIDAAWRQRGVTVVGLALLVYAGYAATAAVRERRATRRAARPTTPQDQETLA